MQGHRQKEFKPPSFPFAQITTLSTTKKTLSLSCIVERLTQILYTLQEEIDEKNKQIYNIRKQYEEEIKAKDQVIRVLGREIRNMAKLRHHHHLDDEEMISIKNIKSINTTYRDEHTHKQSFSKENRTSRIDTTAVDVSFLNIRLPSDNVIKPFDHVGIKVAEMSPRPTAEINHISHVQKKGHVRKISNSCTNIASNDLSFEPSRQPAKIGKIQSNRIPKNQSTDLLVLHHHNSLLTTQEPKPRSPKLAARRGNIYNSYAQLRQFDSQRITGNSSSKNSWASSTRQSMNNITLYGGNMGGTNSWCFKKMNRKFGETAGPPTTNF